ncbi:MAG: DUF2057 domain-containing protein [Desulfobacteraceae bacterium]
MRIGVRKKRWMLAGLICLLYSGNPAWAGIRLELPKQMTAVAVNGEKSKVQGRLNLPDGINQVVVQFIGILGSNYDDDADIGYSDPFVVKFEARNQTLEMVIPHIKRSLDLEKFNRESDIRIVDSASRTVHSDIAKLEKDGIQLFRDFEKELEVFNKRESPAAVNISSAVSKAAVPAETSLAKVLSNTRSADTEQIEFIPLQPDKNMAEKMLKYWYQQADETTRERFKRWISK